jgi:hypothetical protein
MNYEGAAPMINAHSAHSEPEKQHGDLEHVNDITERALYPVIKLRSCASCKGRFEGRDLFAVGDDHLTFFEGDELCRCCARGHGIL